MRKVMILGTALGLAACGPRHLEIGLPPADKLTCPDEPAAPTERGPDGRVTDAAATDYMQALRKAWQGCHEDVLWMAAWAKALNK